MAAKPDKTRKPPWKRAAPAKAAHKKLTPGRKTAAKARAKRAGRPYPNLVDNMRASAPRKRRKGAGRKRARSR